MHIVELGAFLQPYNSSAITVISQCIWDAHIKEQCQL